MGQFYCFINFSFIFKLDRIKLQRIIRNKITTCFNNRIKILFQFFVAFPLKISNWFFIKCFCTYFYGLILINISSFIQRYSYFIFPKTESLISNIKQYLQLFYFFASEIPPAWGTFPCISVGTFRSISQSLHSCHVHFIFIQLND